MLSQVKENLLIFGSVSWYIIIFLLSFLKIRFLLRSHKMDFNVQICTLLSKHCVTKAHTLSTELK